LWNGGQHEHRPGTNATLEPDLVVVDISLKGSNGIELLKNIKVRYKDEGLDAFHA
jgi:DNA-binding NarL/FixJ family response regulator